MSRRSAIRLLVGAAVLPPVLGAMNPTAAAADSVTNLPLPDALRRIEMPDLELTELLQVTGPRHRLTMHRAAWTGGGTYVRDLEVRTPSGWLPVTSPERRFDEQWVVFTGEEGSPNDYYASMHSNWVAFDSMEQVGRRTVELRSSVPGVYDLVVRWNLEGSDPELQWTVTAAQAQHYVVGYQSFDTLAAEDVDEVLCGTRQHARVIEDAQSLGAWELMAPMTLAEHRIDDAPVTLGLYTPRDVLEFEHERELGPDGQPFGMSLRNDTRDVQPVAYAPQAGRRSALEAGESFGYAFGVCARSGPLHEAYAEVVHDEYGYTDYRANIFDTSLTQTVFNLIDLTMIEPADDDSEDFVPSFSGWWNRAKGFVDIENDQSVRTPIAGVLLSAFYLTGRGDLYARRALPLIEYQLSRADIGHSPIKGKPVYGSLEKYRVGQIPGDASTLVPLYRQTRGQSAGLHRLAMRMIAQRPAKDARTPMSTPLQAYELTGNPAYLAEARAEGRRYLRDNIVTAYTTNQGENGFGYNYSKAWTELLVLFELTGETDFLDASLAEARRYITQTQVRPVPRGNVRVPNQPFIDAQLDRWSDSPVLPDYPLDDIPTESVPAWTVSTSGVTFEQLSTFKIGRGIENPGGGFSMIPVWAPFLLRLAQHTGDTLIREVAHNLVVGRFTNYPGYYNRQFVAANMKPDFPLTGPPGTTCIYFHHIPAQLGLALDYLITEHLTRSAGQISFPRQFESNYVFFKYSTYGHAPGTFYGEDGVWPYFPPGIVDVSDHQLNWITAVGNDSLYLSLTSEADTPTMATVTFSPELTGLQTRARYRAELINADGTRESTTIRGGRLRVQVPAKGLRAVVIREVTIDVPWHWVPTATDRSDASFHEEDTDPASNFGLVRALLLPRPARDGYDAYVQIDTETPTTLSYRVGEQDWQDAPAKVFPYEWTIGVDDPTATFGYRLTNADTATTEHTLRLPPSVTGICPPGMDASGEIEIGPDTTPGDTTRARVRVRNGTDSDLTSAQVQLGLPDGWTAEPVDAPSLVPAGGSADWSFDVTVPAAQPAGTVTLAATAGWSGGTADLDGADVTVLAPLRISALTAAPSRLALPGGSTEVTLAVLNVGPLALSGTLTVSVPAGWTATATTVTYDVPGREEREYAFTLTSPASARPGTGHRLVATLETGAERALTIQIAGSEVIVDNSDLWPRYAESGFWLPSTLAGWNGTATRFSEEGKLGGTATWRPDLRTGGHYDVAIWYPTNPETTRAAIYTVHHLGGVDEFEVDQQAGANGWFTLGRFEFEAGSDGFVQVEVRNPGFHRIDATRFLPVDAAALRPAIEALTAAPVAAPGAATTLTATIRSQAQAPVRGDATLRTPPGWTIVPAAVPVDLAAESSVDVEFTLTAPTDAVAGSQHEIVLDLGDASAATAVAITAVDQAGIILVDNEDPGYAESGTWSPSSLPGHDGSPSRYAGGLTGAACSWAAGTPAGRYRVSVWFPGNATTTTAAPYTVVTSDGDVVVVVDQKADAGAWRQLGFFDLAPETAAVRLETTASGHFRSDAARFEPVVGAR
ncbi:hypothetical protein EXU48_08860 [Occultella glacieicola]|uniref:NPCBM-associated, NEW3 domain of alpha-galactosidase n=1 Tax=Occultella glacieicola TaxID=2518684 RepID=A0ABY2E6J3_9MICO|nr:NEW3 domain-containing protein [Occultella glacieicola]TDE94888.1 hypothetical protein EXU48_08860 [Occultella glacieicola]